MLTAFALAFLTVGAFALGISVGRDERKKRGAATAHPLVRLGQGIRNGAREGSVCGIAASKGPPREDDMESPRPPRGDVVAEPRQQLAPIPLFIEAPPARPKPPREKLIVDAPRVGPFIRIADEDAPGVERAQRQINVWEVGRA